MCSGLRSTSPRWRKNTVLIFLRSELECGRTWLPIPLAMDGARHSQMSKAKRSVRAVGLLRLPSAKNGHPLSISGPALVPRAKYLLCNSRAVSSPPCHPERSSAFRRTKWLLSRRTPVLWKAAKKLQGILTLALWTPLSSFPFNSTTTFNAVLFSRPPTGLPYFPWQSPPSPAPAHRLGMCHLAFQCDQKRRPSSHRRSRRARLGFAHRPSTLFARSANRPSTELGHFLCSSLPYRRTSGSPP